MPEETRSGVNFFLQKRAFSKTRILVLFLCEKCVILVKVTKKNEPLFRRSVVAISGAFYNPERLMRLPGKSASERLEPPP